MQQLTGAPVSPCRIARKPHSMLRLPMLLQAVLFAALAAVPCVHALSGLQDPSDTSQLRQAHFDDSFTVSNAVVVGEASAEVQAAFDRDTGAAAGSSFRTLLEGEIRGPAVSDLPRCNKCLYNYCNDRLCTGYCRRTVKGQDDKVFTCQRSIEQ